MGAAIHHRHRLPGLPCGMVMRLLSRRAAGARRPLGETVEPHAWCPDCGLRLDNVQGTVVGAFRGECPEHGDVDDALTA
jgi:hypothetical protein